MNGRDVRQKDVALLFADAATGAHSPALVSQGKISAVIAAKPTERRLMLEEAAGIAGLHVRRKDAEQKLRATEANLIRLDEILADMELRGAALKRQARAAERYRKLSEQIRVAEARLVFARWREAAEAAEAAKAESEAADGAVAQAAEARLAAAAWQNDAVGRLADLRKAAEGARERASELGHRLAALRAERDGVTRRIAELEGRQRTLAADRQREEALKADAAAAIARLDEELAAIAARLAEAESRRGTIDVRTVDHEDAARAADTALGQARAVQAAEQAEARVATAALEAARTRLARVEGEAARLAEQMGALGADADLVQSLAQARTDKESAEKALAAAGEKVANAETRRAEAAVARDTAESEAASARAALAALQSEARALLKAVEGASGDRAINHVRAASGYERALAAALGEDLEAGLGAEGTRRWAGAAPLPGDPALPAGTQTLADHVDAPPALLRRLRQIAVVEIDAGQPLAVGQRLVTLDGRLRRWDGYVATGMGAAAAERLIRVNRLAEIETAMPAANQAVALAGDKARAAMAGMQEAREAADAGRRAETGAATALREAGRAEDQANVEIERLELRRTGLAERAALAEADLTEAQQTLAGAETVAAALPDAAATEAKVASLREEAELRQGALAEVRAEAATWARAVERRQAARRGRPQGAGGLACSRRRGRHPRGRVRRPHRRGGGRGEAPGRGARQASMRRSRS